MQGLIGCGWSDNYGARLAEIADTAEEYASKVLHANTHAGNADDRLVG